MSDPEGTPSQSASGEDDISPGGEQAPVYSKPYVRYVVGILTVIYVFNFIDRQILSILLPSIKAEFELSDTALGFLTGFAFAAFYATLGMPIARLADKHSRVTIISICLTIWSAMTVLCGMAGSYLQLLVARIGVGIGEAGGSPSSHSLIADYVPVEGRSTALGIYSLGVSIGILFGFLAGGWLDEFFGWRTAFLVVGIPGVILAVIMRLTVKEPPRGYSEGGLPDDSEQPGMREVFRHLWSQRSFRHIAFGSALHAFVGYGVIQWMPSFLHRSHGMETWEIASWLAPIIGIGGGIGSVFGGMLADKLGKRDIRWQMWISAAGLFIGAPFAIGVYLSPDPYTALAYFVLPTIIIAVYHGPVYAMTQGLAPVRMRAMAAAVLLFITNIIGLGLGPQVVGIISDLLKSEFGIHSLRYALLSVTVLYIWSGVHYLLAAKTLKVDLARVTN